MKQGKTHVTPKKSPINKQADAVLRQIRRENAIRDLAKSNRQKGIVTMPTTSTPTLTRANKTAKSKKSK